MSVPDTMGVSQKFDRALYAVSDYLVEAHRAHDQGNPKRAAAFYSVAEWYATRTGYLELLRLVWAYDDTVFNKTCRTAVAAMPSVSALPAAE